MSRPFVFRMLIGLGLLARLWALPCWGTFDTEVQKAWAARAATAGVADIYGPDDRSLVEWARGEGGLSRLLRPDWPRTTFTWGGASYFVDYPPGSVLELWLAGRAYRVIDSEIENRWPFNVAINVIPLLASVVIAVLLYRTAPGATGQVRCLAFWLNPAVFLAAPVLGYQDTIFGAFALGAVLAMAGSRLSLATALVIAAGLVKPQGVLLVPALAVVLWRGGSMRTVARALAAGVLTAVVILAPWWGTGHLLSALDGCRRPLTQPTLAPLGLNVWWVAGWLRDHAVLGGWPLARIVGIDEFQAWAGFSPRAAGGLALLLLGVVPVVRFLSRSPHLDALRMALAVLVSVHAYALLATSVHENHTFLAVVLAPLLLGAWRHGRGTLLGTSAILFASLFLAAGFGRRITKQREIAVLRGLTGVDLTVIVALLHVVLFVVLLAWMMRDPPEEADPAGSRVE